MTDALHLAGWNQLIASGMALAIWLLSLTPFLRRRPALLHGLWLLVFLKLVAPPVMSVEVPSVFSAAATDTMTGEAAATRTFVQPAEPKQTARPVGATTSVNVGCCAPPTLASAANASPTPTVEPIASMPTTRDNSTSWRTISVGCVAVSLAVTALYWSLVLRQLFRIRRWFCCDAVVCGHAEKLLRDVGKRFGMRTPVTLRIVNEPISPLLWAWPGKSIIVLPQRLVLTLDDESLRSILAHELAHLVRRDHWTNLFVFAVTSLLWWNPIVWFVQRRLLAASEACCDALALERLQGSRKTYAATLLTVVDSLKETPRQGLAFGMTFGSSHSLRKRFELLADNRVSARTSRVGWLILAAAMIGSLFVPARAGEPATPAPTRSSTQTVATYCCPEPAAARDTEAEGQEARDVQEAARDALSATSRETKSLTFTGPRLERLSRAYKTFSGIGYFVESATWHEVLPLAKPQAEALLELDELVWNAREVAWTIEFGAPAANLPEPLKRKVTFDARQTLALRNAEQMVKLGFFTSDQAAFVTQRQLSNEQFKKNALLHDPFLREQLNLTLTESQRHALVFTAFDTAASEILSDEQWDKLVRLTAMREPPQGPPELAVPTPEQLAQVKLTATFKRIDESTKALGLSEDQLRALHELERLTRLGLHWIDQREPSDGNEKTREKFLDHAGQVALLGILTPDQAREYLMLC